MLFADGALGLAVLALWVFALLDVITADEVRIRHLPKWGWFIVVLLLGELAIGPLLWLLAGRPVGPSRSLPDKENNPIPPEYDRPGRAVASSPDDDAAFLRSLRERAEQQRKTAEELRQSDDGPPSP